MANVAALVCVQETVHTIHTKRISGHQNARPALTLTPSTLLAHQRMKISSLWLLLGQLNGFPWTFTENTTQQWLGQTFSICIRFFTSQGIVHAHTTPARQHTSGWIKFQSPILCSAKHSWPPGDSSSCISYNTGYSATNVLLTLGVVYLVTYKWITKRPQQNRLGTLPAGVFFQRASTHTHHWRGSLCTRGVPTE